jgi:hypothetical protein
MANDDNNTINQNWTIGTSANGEHENVGNELEMKMIALKVFKYILRKYYKLKLIVGRNDSQSNESTNNMQYRKCVNS